MLLGAVSVTALTLTVISPSASAKPGYFTFPAERTSQVTVKGAQGFQITIRRVRGYVELTASNGNTLAIYIVRPAKVPLDRIVARFPGLGRVSLRLHPIGEAQYLPPFCGGRPSIKQAGIFRGTIKFSGERGFTRAFASHARGYMYRSFKEVCRRSDGDFSDEPIPGYSLTATARSHGRGVLFGAFRATDESITQGDTYYSALMSERRRGMLIGRLAFARARPDTYVVEGPNTRPVSATVTPPAPFSGDASFHWVPGMSAEWSGSLSVDLPGAGTVPLTGDSFESELCLNKHCVGRPRASASGDFLGRSEVSLSGA